MSSRFFHIVALVIGFSSLLRLNNIPLWVHATFLIRASFDGRLGCVHILVIVNNATVSRGCRHLFKILISSLLDIYTEVGLLHHIFILFLIFWGTAIIFSIVAIQQHIRVPFSPHSCQWVLSLGKCLLRHLTILNGIICLFFMLLSCMSSLYVSDINHLSDI